MFIKLFQISSSSGVPKRFLIEIWLVFVGQYVEFKNRLRKKEQLVTVFNKHIFEEQGPLLVQKVISLGVWIISYYSVACCYCTNEEFTWTLEMYPLHSRMLSFWAGPVESSDKTKQNLSSLVNFRIDKLVSKQVLTLTQRLQAAIDRNILELVKCK